jgi:hypothetical protein
MTQLLEPFQEQHSNPIASRKVHCVLLEGSPLQVSVIDVVTGYGFRVDLEQFSPVVTCQEALNLCLEGQLETAILTKAWVQLKRNATPAS